MRSESIEYREALAQDLESVVEIFNQNIEAGDSTLWQAKFSIDSFRHRFQPSNDREKLYVVVQHNQVIGWGMIKKYHEKEGYSAACETSVFLHRNMIGQGIGTSFKAFIIQECQKLKYHHINAKILASNKRSIHYNLKLGYQIVGLQREIGRIKGKWVDVMIMQYIIGEQKVLES